MYIRPRGELTAGTLHSIASGISCQACLRSDVRGLSEVPACSHHDSVLTQGMDPDLSLLQGEVLVNDAQLEAFSAASLPARPAERFTALFAHRQQWAADDLKPYIASLEVSRCISASTAANAALLAIRGSDARTLLCYSWRRQSITRASAGTRAINRGFAAALHARHAASR